MAHHLERTALRVLADCAPDFTPLAVPHAVALIDRQSPVVRSPAAEAPAVSAAEMSAAEMSAS